MFLLLSASGIIYIEFQLGGNPYAGLRVWGETTEKLDIYPALKE